MSKPVRVWEDCLVLPTYLPAAPDKNPMFLEKRVYQGSSGRVYPLPFTDRIAETKTDRQWKVVWLENEFLKVMILPELGGRIHALVDKTNGYDLIYRQDVIKPALVGLAGPWLSGGIEFNWPQHHRPATFLPVDTEIEKHADGSVTVWCGDHDPMCRMKGMHGVCLHPGRAYLELKVRAYNRTPFAQTFLWWANVATRVHEAYQSFFPPDVHGVADHARRSMSAYPLAQGRYYGVNYGARGRTGIPLHEAPAQFIPPYGRRESQDAGHQARIPDYAPNDLSWYANIPVPTSYMCVGSRQDFFGGYDHHAQAGIVHFASHHIAPGKKQWTWGNHDFGYAWDRNLTDADDQGEFAPYIELMAGVFTDNQPDFSFLQPGETKAWSQYWYPIQKIGPAQHANLEAAVSLRRSANRRTAAVQIGVSVTAAHRKARITVQQVHEEEQGRGGALPGTTAPKTLAHFTRDLAPGKPFLMNLMLPKGARETDLLLRVTDVGGREIISYRPKDRVEDEVPPPATEPPPPQDIGSADELYVTGLHLAQYRHATRCPTAYWREGLRRDPLDARCNNAMGLWHLHRGEFRQAETHFRRAIERLTRRNANPYDGEPYYNLGLCLRYLGRDDEAYDALYKATWNQAWAGAAFHMLAEIDCCRQNWATACDHAQRACQTATRNQRALNLWAITLKKSGDGGLAKTMLPTFRQTDPLDWWTRHLLGEELTCDLQTCLDVAHDYARAGLYTEAIQLLAERLRVYHAQRRSGRLRPAVSSAELPDQSWGAEPLIQYTLGWLHAKRGDAKSALKHYRAGAALPPDYCFPARLEEIGILETAMTANPRDARARYYLGNLLYDRRRHEEAIGLWERSARLDASFSIVWRNLGLGYFNVRQQRAKARAAYDRAFRLNPADARLLYERDQLWKRLGVAPNKRLRELERRLDLVRQRDDLSVELCALYNQTGRHEQALALVSNRRFQPWEGGEGGALGQWVRSHLALGRDLLSQGDAAKAREHFEAALNVPHNLGESRHLLANSSDIHYWLGCALAQLGQQRAARAQWRVAATFQGDFQEMSVRAFSEMTYYSARSWERLGRKAKARQMFKDLLHYAQRLRKTPARIDYFATSLPTMLIFEDDLQHRQQASAMFLEAQARLGLGGRRPARLLLQRLLRIDPSHAAAADLLAACG